MVEGRIKLVWGFMGRLQWGCGGLVARFSSESGGQRLGFWPTMMKKVKKLM